MSKPPSIDSKQEYRDLAGLTVQGDVTARCIGVQLRHRKRAVGGQLGDESPAIRLATHCIRLQRRDSTRYRLAIAARSGLESAATSH